MASAGTWSDISKFCESLFTFGRSDAQDEINRFGREVQAQMPQFVQDAKDLAAGRDLLARSEGSFATSDEILVAGEAGLRFFQRYLPHYNEWTYEKISFEHDILQRYHKFRGMNFAAFRDDAEHFAKAGASLGEGHGRMKQSFTGLITHWSGDASRAAGEHVDKFLRASEQVTARATDFGRVLAKNAAHMEKVVRQVAGMTADLYSVDCGGHSPGTVEKMIKVVRGKSDSPFLNFLATGLDVTGGGLKSASGMLPEAGAAASSMIDLGMGLISHFRKCLTEQFQPAFKNKYERFVKEICTASEDNLNKMWAGFAEAAKEVPRDAFAGVPLIVPRPVGT
ncbi:WXG100 family type VII secretion target [Crossiella sp. CA198]|uniref:WXG100 family type VII secretion target n=1 Tax=Crossiella sp. CA198 TaxID=3455607 RepID=UPI003F8D896B